MLEIKVVQVGDIHFPESRGQTRVDLKDKSFPPDVRDAVTVSPLQNSVRQLLRESDGADALLICGDLTSRGDLAQYKDCADYLNEALELEKWAPNGLHIVPGNHDVNLQEAKASTNLFDKFRPLERVWKTKNLSVLAADAARQTTLVKSKARIRVISLNSCIGCQEVRYLPTSIQSELGKLLQEFEARSSIDDAFKLIGESLDTPAFHSDHLDSLNEVLLSLEPNEVPIILAHHNLLPQALARVQLYTELINSGRLRARLARHKSPVLYLHGHIHDDPIELLVPDSFPCSPLVAISAPLLSVGFNVIRVQFGRNKQPLGAIIEKFRASRDSDLALTATHRITLAFGNVNELYQRCTPAVRAYLSDVRHTPEGFPTVLERSRKRTPRLRSPTLARALTEAEWLGFVEIQNRDAEAHQWIVRRLLP